MAKRWDLEEKMLIEIFGCGTVENRVIEAFPGKEKDAIYSAFYHDGNGLEMALIEIFGCVPLDKVINLDVGRSAKKTQHTVTLEDTATMVVGLA